MKLWLGAAALSMLAGSACAQDFIPYVSIHAESMIYRQMLDANLGRGDATPGRRAAPRPGTTARPAVDLTSPARADAAPIALPYTSTATLRQSVADAYVDRIAKADAKTGRLVAAELARHDFGRVYAGIVRPFGYRDNDAADALAAYTLLGWLIASGAPDPTIAQARGVRLQIAQRLSADGRLVTPDGRGALAEELKLSFVILHAGWQSARRDGTLRAYSDGVAALFAKLTGGDPRALRLTDRGFVAGSA